MSEDLAKPGSREVDCDFLVIGSGAAGLSAAVTAAWHAAEFTGTLKKINDSGTITLGVRDASIPFSYLDDRQDSVGYSVDLCLKVVDAVKDELKKPDLKVVKQVVTSATRIPLIANGTVDIECGSTVNNIERQKQVAFSVTTFVVNTKLIVKKNGPVQTFGDMVYPALTYLEEVGYATVEADGSKKLYHITDAGRTKLNEDRAFVDSLMAQLARIGDKMDRVRKAFASEDQADLSHRAVDEARQTLRAALIAKLGASPSDEELKRISEVLQRAADELRRVKK